MDPKYSNQVRQTTYTAASDTGYAFNGGQHGQVMFKKACAGCNTIGHGDRAGPDLRGVAERRDRGWLSAFIRDPVKVLARKDPVALALAEKFPAVRMPRLGLTENDVADLLLYVEAEASRLGATAQHTSAMAHRQHHQE